MSRGVEDILIASVDGFVGFPDAITSVFPPALETRAPSALGKRYPAMAETRRSHWPHVAPVFAQPPEIRRMPYTTNADAATRLLCLALRNIQAKWQRRNHAWEAATPYLAMLFGSRFTYHGRSPHRPHTRRSVEALHVASLT